MTHPVIKQAILALAAKCDGAASQDGVGFNGGDSRTGKRLAVYLLNGGEMTAGEQQEWIYRLRVYTKQLQGYGVDLPSDSDLASYLDSVDSPVEGFQVSRYCQQQEKQERIFVVDNDTLGIQFSYDPSKVSLVKTLQNPKPVWNAAAKTWLVSWVHAQQLLDLFPEIDCDDAVEVKIKEWSNRVIEVQPKPEPKAPGKVQLVGQNLIVSFGYKQQYVDKCKEIKAELKAGSYNGEGKFWQFPLSASELIALAFPEFEFDSAIADSVASARAEALAIEAQKQVELQRLIDAANLDGDFNGRSLYQHQKDSVRWAINQIQSTDLRGVILALDMGLGKTTVSLVAAKAYQSLFNIPVFVICPASLKDNWKREAELIGCQIEVFSWAKMAKPLEHSEYILIADEAHYAQAGQKSQRGKNFIELATNANCKAAMFLTGTPLKNGRPVNLYPLLKASNHCLAKDKKGYEVRYCAARPTRFCPWDTTGAAHLDELHANTRDVILRRMKSECLDLPEKTRIFRTSEVTGDRLSQWKDAFREAKARYDEMREELNPASAIVLMGQLRKAGSIAKVDTAIEIAEEILSQGNQVVLFTEFLESAKELQSILGGELLIGDTPVEDRQAMVDRFQSGESKVFISTSRAGGVGITLTKAQDVIMVDRPWTPGDAIQCEDRCHRIGQKSAVSAIWLQYGEIDEKVDSILAEKHERIELVLQGKRKTLRGIKSPKDVAVELARSIFKD